MGVSLLALMNAVLLAAQLSVHASHATKLRRMRRRHETLVAASPAFATASWVAIYALLALAVGCDVVTPSLSLFQTAPHPNLLRLLFSVACLANCVWIWTMAHGYVYLATLAVAAQWGALWTLYVFVVFVTRSHRANAFSGSDSVHQEQPPFSLARYMATELGLVLYTAWTCYVMVETAAAAMQKYFRSCLSFASYSTLLCTFSLVVNWTVVLYEDCAFGLLGVWALVTVSAKRTSWGSATIERLHDSVQENAVQLAVVTATVLTILLSLIVSKNESSAEEPPIL